MNVRKTTTLALSVGALAATAWAPGIASDANEAAAVVTCGSRQATIVGTAGNDRIGGTAEPDVIASLGGNDVVRGLGGDDLICLGNGRDAAKGGAGDDQFRSDAPDGNDTYVGDSGRDTMSYLLRTRALDVTIDGEPDDGEGDERDNVRFSVENVTGGQASDLIIGSDVTNALFGGNGEDDLRGGLGNDSISGGNDDDFLIGNAGDDFGFGNAGDDTWFAAAVDDGSDFFEGSVGIDTATYEGRNAGDPVTVRIDNIANDGSAGEGDNIRLDVENITGGSGNDTIAANQFQSERNTLRGEAGNDTISSVDAPHLAEDIVNGGDSNDLCLTDNDDTRLSCEF